VIADLASDPIAVVDVATPWGPAAVAAGSDGVHGLGLLSTVDGLARVVARRTGRPVVPRAEAPRAALDMLSAATTELERYVRQLGRGFVGWHVPIRLDGVSAWDRRVLDTVARIPWGSTMSYGQVARAAGSPGAARAAGAAVGRNPIGLMIPCHRVIAGDGTIGGYGGSWPADRDALIALKRALLEHEGSHPA
jgi:methylated-DNA-[protein]-cysteine S-methyltransferase